MKLGVISHSYTYLIKRKELEASLLEKHKDQLENADPKERKRITKDIEKQIEEALKELPKLARLPKYVIC